MKQTLKYIYDKLYEQVKYAEAKHSISITLASALTVFSATYLANEASLIKALSAISIIFSLISVLYSFLALSVHNLSLKRFKPKREAGEGNLLYYNYIKKFDEKSYVEEITRQYPFLKGYRADNLDFNLARQVITTAKAISQKFLFFNFALTFLIFSLITQASSIVLLGVK